MAPLPMSRRSVWVDFIDSDVKIAEEMKLIGVDPVVISSMTAKTLQPVIKITKVKNVAANILKQEMLSLDGDAAVARGTITHSVEYTDILLIGNLRTYSRLKKKLKQQPFGLSEISDKIDEALRNYQDSDYEIICNSHTLDLNDRVHIMGILNITPDSFFDGGKFHANIDKAVACAEQMAWEGADIIDIGGESSRPGAAPLSDSDECERVIPVIKRLVKTLKVPISIDTYKPSVAKQALDAGASMINDIGGLQLDPNMAKVASEYKAPVIIMHMQGRPQTMQESPQYDSLMSDIMSYLNESIRIAEDVGFGEKKIIIDPGIGFGKTTEDSLSIISSLSRLKTLGKPILIGASRKSFIGNTLNLPTEERLEGSLAVASIAVQKGARIVRTHDVRETGRVIRMVERL